MKCDACGTEKARCVTIKYTRKEGRLEFCDICGDSNFRGIPDVYLGVGGLQTDPNLCDKKTLEPIPFHTKREKAEIMKRLKVKQATSAERVHGSRNEAYLSRKIYSFPK